MPGILQARFWTPAAAPPAGKTWNPALKGPNITLSSGDTVATQSMFSWNSVGAVPALTSGDIVTFTVMGPGFADAGLGLSTSSLNTGSYIGSDTTSGGIGKSGNFQYNNGNVGPAQSTWAVGDTVAMKYLGTTVAYSINGGAYGSAITLPAGLTGTVYPAAGIYGTGANVVIS